MVRTTARLGENERGRKGLRYTGQTAAETPLPSSGRITGGCKASSGLCVSEVEYRATFTLLDKTSELQNVLSANLTDSHRRSYKFTQFYNSPPTGQRYEKYTVVQKLRYESGIFRRDKI